MEPFVHKNLVNDFFTVLHAPDPGVCQEGIHVVRGCTAKQDAVASALAGSLTLQHLPKFAASLRDLLTGAVQLIVLDLSRIHEFCPNAASVLVNFVSFVEGGGKRLILFRPSPAVLDLLRSLHLIHLFEIQQTEEELLLSLPD